MECYSCQNDDGEDFHEAGLPAPECREFIVNARVRFVVKAHSQQDAEWAVSESEGAEVDNVLLMSRISVDLSAP